MWPLNLNVEKCPVTSLHLFSNTQSADGHADRQKDRHIYTHNEGISKCTQLYPSTGRQVSWEVC